MPTSLSAFVICLTFVAAFLAFSPSVSAQDAQFEPLFNGNNLLGWHVNEKGNSFKVEDGCLVAHGDRAHAFYVGKSGHASFKNFHLKAKVKTEPGANSGIYFHTQYQAAGWPTKGYESQVNNSHRDPKKTGGLYGVQDNFEAPANDNEWFDYEIIVDGKHIVIKIDGKTISDYTEPDSPKRKEGMEQRVLSRGTIAIQAHDPKSKVYYKDLMIKTLP